MSFLLKGLVFLALVLFALLFLFRSKFKFHVFSFLRRNQFLLFNDFVDIGRHQMVLCDAGKGRVYSLLLYPHNMLVAGLVHSDNQ